MGKLRETRRSIASWSFWWEDDAEQLALMATYLFGSADVGAGIGRDRIIDLPDGDRDPLAVHFDFIVAAYHAAPGWTTIGIVAARPGTIISSELCVKVSMPFIMAGRIVSFLCQRKRRQRC